MSEIPDDDEEIVIDRAPLTDEQFREFASAIVEQAIKAKADGREISMECELGYLVSEKDGWIHRELNGTSSFVLLIGGGAKHTASADASPLVREIVRENNAQDRRR